MKKIIVLLGALFVFVGGISSANVISANEVAKMSSASGYEFVQSIQAVHVSGWNKLRYDLYRDGSAYYVKSGSSYYPVRDSNKDGYRYMFYLNGDVANAWYFSF